MKSFILLITLLLSLTMAECELPETTPPPPTPTPSISNLYEEIRYNPRTDLNLVRSTATLNNAPPDSIHITYDCFEETLKRKTTASYIFFYEVQVHCKSALEISYTFFYPERDTTIVNTYPAFLFTPEAITN